MPFQDSSYYNCDPEDNPTLLGNCTNGRCGQMNETQMWRYIGVYIPASYKDGNETGVMVVLDGGGNFDFFTTGNFEWDTNAMDNLIDSNNDERSLPSFIVIKVASWIGEQETLFPECGLNTGEQRHKEYKPMSDKYVRFMNDEVFPFVTNYPDIKSKYSNLKITDNPAGRAAYVCRDGGVAELTMAFLCPDIFGIVIAYAPSLVKISGSREISEEYPLDNAEFWVPKPEGQELIISEPKKPI